MHPSSASPRSKAGKAVIAFDFAATATWPNTSRLVAAQALTRWSAAWPAPRSCERRSVLPSRATTSPAVCVTAARTHARKPGSNCRGSSAANTRPKGSCDGMPWGSARKVRSQASFACPNSSTSTHESAPQRTAQIAIVTTSSNWWRLVRSMRGSGTAAKCSRRLGPPG